MDKTGYLIIFTIGTLITQAICLGIYFFAKVDNEVGIVYEVLELLPIYILVTGLFRRCPVCGKRKLTIVDSCGGSRYTLDDAECRNCKSEIRIQRDSELHETSYYRMRGNVTTTRINPIWETEENNPYGTRKE
jgi:hypothetical protein